MRPLTEKESRAVFEKLSKFIGDNLRFLLDRPDGNYCFRLHRGRIYYAKESIMKWATNIKRKNLVCLGVCVGKFTKSGRFHLQVTALDVLGPYAKSKMWVKSSAEQSFLYGNHVSKSGLGRITENVHQYQGIVIYSMSDLPLGFGVTAKAAKDIQVAPPATVLAFHQADIGQYVRSENSLL